MKKRVIAFVMTLVMVISFGFTVLAGPGRPPVLPRPPYEVNSAPITATLLDHEGGDTK